MSGFWVSRERPGAAAVVGLLDLGVGDGDGPEVGRRGRHHDRVGAAAAVEHGLAQLGGGLDADDLDAGRVGAASTLAATRVTSAPRAAAVRARA